MINRFLAGLFAMTFCFIIALPAHAQDPPTKEEKGRPPRFVVTSPPPAQASMTPEKKALIKELTKLLNATNNSEEFAKQMMEKMREPFVMLVSQGLSREFANQKLSPVEERRLKSETDEAAHRILDRVRAEIPKRINIDEVVEQFGFEVYGRHFTEDELKELVILYKSPTAQKFVRIFPQIFAEASPRIEALMKPTLTKLIDELVIEEKKRLKSKWDKS